jgi:predicted metal-binding membrane protein
MALAFLSVNQRRREASRPVVSTYIFILGYVAVWTAYSALAALAQWLLHGAAWMTPGMAVASPVVVGLLLIAAGVYQWTPLKERCLVGCRSPLGFLMSRWQEGRWGAWRMGLEHGSYCVGCCWVLMALLFATGVMNLAWVGVIAVFVIAEKLVPAGPFFGRVTGALLAAAGVLFLVRSV